MRTNENFYAAQQLPVVILSCRSKHHGTDVGIMFKAVAAINLALQAGHGTTLNDC